MIRFASTLIIIMFSVISFYTTTALGAVTDQIQIKGTLKAITKDYVILDVKAGSKMRPIKIKRSEAGDLHGLITGKAVVVIRTSLADFVKLNRGI